MKLTITPEIQIARTGLLNTQAEFAGEYIRLEASTRGKQN